jgi:hypothetical protein
MPRPSKMTPTLIARLRALRAPDRPGGALSLRAAAREIGLPYETVRGWEAKVKPAPADAATADAIVSSPPPVPDAGEPGALDGLRERARMIAALLARLAPAVEAETYSATSFVSLAKYADELARTIAGLEPPAPVDPETDATTIEAERTLLTRLEGMICDAEREARP